MSGMFFHHKYAYNRIQLVIDKSFLYNRYSSMSGIDDLPHLCLFMTRRLHHDYFSTIQTNTFPWLI
jgi:hypothetical protein